MIFDVALKMESGVEMEMEMEVETKLNMEMETKMEMKMEMETKTNMNMEMRKEGGCKVGYDVTVDISPSFSLAVQRCR